MPTGEGQGLGCPWQCPPNAGWCGTAPDDAWVFPPVPCRPAPLLHHHHGLPTGEEATEEKGEWGCEQQAQAVEGIVACQAGAAEVKGRVQLDGDRGQQQADAIHQRLGAGLEVLEEHAELIHGSRLVGAVRLLPPSYHCQTSLGPQEGLLVQGPGGQGGGSVLSSVQPPGSCSPRRLSCPARLSPNATPLLSGRMSHCSVTSQPKAPLSKCALPCHSIPPRALAHSLLSLGFGY